MILFNLNVRTPQNTVGYVLGDVCKRDKSHAGLIASTPFFSSEIIERL